MFNILGSFLFGMNSVAKSEVVEANDHQQNESEAMTAMATGEMANKAATAVTIRCETGTQTTATAGAMRHTEAEDSENASKSNMSNSNSNEVAQPVNSNSPRKQQVPYNDWIIIDRGEIHHTGSQRTDIGVNTSMCVDSVLSTTPTSTIETTTAAVAADIIDLDTTLASKQTMDCDVDDDDEDVLLGSFFDKQEHADEDEEEDDDEMTLDKHELVLANNSNNTSEMLMMMMKTMQQQQTKREDWLITPLPCLTSITSSARSIVDNHPFENLLIEHPSMSVFFTATSSSAHQRLHQQYQQQQHPLAPSANQYQLQHQHQQQQAIDEEQLPQDDMIITNMLNQQEEQEKQEKMQQQQTIATATLTSVAGKKMVNKQFFIINLCFCCSC